MLESQYVIFIGYFLLVFFIGWLGMRWTRSDEDYWIAGSKLGWGIGGALAGWLLALFQFVPNEIQTDTSINGMKLMVSIVPGILYMSCALFLFFYNIDKETEKEMQLALENRRDDFETD